jgi:2-octaprenyl-6-methoxyphenol hydroxylase
MAGAATAAVVGAGPAGLVTALALAKINVAVTIVAPRPTQAGLAADTRTFAALGGSLELFRALGVWEDLEPQTAPLQAIRLIDDRGGVLRAPEVMFRAEDVGLGQFGANIPQAALGAGLTAAVDRTPQIAWRDTSVTSLRPGDRSVTLSLADASSLEVAIVAAADGRASLGRAAAGIETSAWQYPQSALACVFGHSRPHGGISTEFHRVTGPLTTVPMPDGPDGPRSSLVWVETPSRALELKGLDEPAFLAALRHHLQGLLGSLSNLGARAVFPLSGLEAKSMGQNRIALVGEAGHVLPPIGAQGLNLGLRDAATLADCLEDAIAQQADIGAPAILAAYASRRSRDVSARTFAIDLLNRSLLSTALPFDAARGISLHAMALSPTLRRMAIRQGLEPIGPRPRLMLPRVTPPKAPKSVAALPHQAGAV